jgi:hypothetical protein
MRVLIRDHKRAATCLGFGPRFHHYTRQAYKGGPNTGVFLQITCDDGANMDVPAQKFSFRVVKTAEGKRVASSSCWPSAAGLSCASISAHMSHAAAVARIRNNPLRHKDDVQ